MTSVEFSDDYGGVVVQAAGIPRGCIDKSPFFFLVSLVLVRMRGAPRQKSRGGNVIGASSGAPLATNEAGLLPRLFATETEQL